MKKLILLPFLLMLMYACTGLSGTKKSSDKDFVAVEQNSEILDATFEIKPVRRVYCSEGLKYLTIIILDMKENGEVSGKVSSIEYIFLDDDNDERHEKAFFKGKIRENIISVEFDGNPPVVGDNSNWTDDDWRIEMIDDVETIVIPFYAKNYETSEWSLTDYEFHLSDKYNEYEWMKLHSNE